MPVWIVLLLLHAGSVDNVNDVWNCNTGFGNVGGQDNSTHAFWWWAEDLALFCRGDCRMQVVDTVLGRVAQIEVEQREFARVVQQER